MGDDDYLPDPGSMHTFGSDAVARRRNDIARQPAQSEFIHLRRKDADPALREGIKVETFAESDRCHVIGATFH
jgi:hypothetical protein